MSSRKTRNYENDLAAILDGIADGFFAVDRNLRYTQCDRGCEEYYSLRREDLIGRRLDERFPSFRGTVFEHALERAMTQRQVIALDAMSTTRPGHRLTMRVFPFGDGVAAAFRDITERFQTEEAAVERERQFRILADSIPQLAWMAEANGWIFWFNQRWFNYTGATLDEVRGRGWHKIPHPDHLERVLAGLERSWARGEPWEDTFPMRGHDGSYRWFLTRAVPVRDSGGRVVRWFGTNTDITEQRETELKLKQLNEKLAQNVDERTRERDRIWRLSRDLLAVSDFEGRTVVVNPAWEPQLGYRPDDLVGRHFTEFLHPDELEGIQKRYQLTSAGQPLENYEARIRHADGSWRWVSWNAVVEEGYIYSMGRDITAQKEAEAELLQAQKLDALGQLTGGVAHDFNNLLQAISASLHVVSQITDDPRATKMIAAGLQAVDRGAKLTQQLMAFSRRQALRPEPMDVRDRLLGMSTLLARVLRADIEVDMHIGRGLWPVKVDPTQFELAVINLAVNARDAMPEGGRLLLSADNRHIASDQKGGGGDFVEFTVSDSGVGMPAEVVQRAFDPFFTTKEVGKGSGLGLAMVYGFARQSGGTATIHSSPGKGTRVCLCLPRSDETPAALDDAMAEVPGSIAGARILLVEDDAIVGNLVAAALNDLGCLVTQVTNADEALARLAEDQHFDLLFTDVIMPGTLSGADLAREVKRLYPGIPVLLTTGYRETAETDGLRVLAKPYRMDALVAALKSELQRTRPQ